MKNEEISKTLFGLLDYSRDERLYERLVIEATQHVPVDMGTLLLKEGDLFKNKFSTKTVGSISTRRRGFTQKAFTTGKPQIIDAEKLFRIHPQLEGLGCCSFAVFPIAYGDSRKGVFYFGSRKKNFFTERYFSFLQQYSSQSLPLLQNLEAFSLLDNAVKQRELFMSTAAHELKNPLTAVKAYEQMLIRKMEKEKPSFFPFLHRFDKEIDRTIEMVSEYLGVRLRFDYKKEKHSLLEAVQRALQSVRISHPSYTFRLFTCASARIAFVVIDENKFIQVIVNVLNNAAKFSVPKHPIEIHIEESIMQWQIIIQDHGLGIKKEDLNKVFQRFYQADTKKEGMGLGLYLARNIMLAHNGDIKIVSHDGKGTKVILMLPKHT